MLYIGWKAKDMSNILRKAICTTIVIALISLQIAELEASGTIQVSSILSSSGSISYTLSETPMPEPSNYRLPLTGLGGDYTLYFSDSPITIWTDNNNYWLNKLAYWRDRGYTDARLAFVFSGANGNSHLDYTKWSTMLGFFDNINVKVIATLQNNPAFNPQPDSSYVWDNWIAFATYYKGDTRMSAFDLFSEPGLNPKSTSSNLAITQFYANLIHAIHAVDPNRVVIFPCLQTYYDTAQQAIADLQSTGITSESNTVFDIVHPYWMDTYSSWTTMPNWVKWYENNWIKPFVTALGASKSWSGETFGHTDNTTAEHGSEWMKLIINKFVDYGVGFNVYCVLGYSTEFSINEAGMKASNYQP